MKSWWQKTKCQCEHNNSIENPSLGKLMQYERKTLREVSSQKNVQRVCPYTIQSKSRLQRHTLDWWSAWRREHVFKFARSDRKSFERLERNLSQTTFRRRDKKRRNIWNKKTRSEARALNYLNFLARSNDVITVTTLDCNTSLQLLENERNVRLVRLLRRNFFLETLRLTASKYVTNHLETQRKYLKKLLIVTVKRMSFNTTVQSKFIYWIVIRRSIGEGIYEIYKIFGSVIERETLYFIIMLLSLILTTSRLINHDFQKVSPNFSCKTWRRSEVTEFENFTKNRHWIRIDDKVTTDKNKIKYWSFFTFENSCVMC